MAEIRLIPKENGTTDIPFPDSYVKRPCLSIYTLKDKEGKQSKIMVRLSRANVVSLIGQLETMLRYDFPR